MSMSEVREKARALIAAATPGPWIASNDTQPVRVVAGSMATSHRLGSLFVCGQESGGYTHPVSLADAELIAFAVNNLITLCDTVVALQNERDQLRKDWDNALSVSTAHFQSEILALRAQLEKERAKVRKVKGRARQE